MEEKQVYVQGDFSFIKNNDLKKLFEKSYQNDNEIISTDSDMYFWAKEKIDEKTDDCWKSFVKEFNENNVLEEYNKLKNKPTFSYVSNGNNEPITKQNGIYTVSVGGKRKSRKSGKKTMRKSRKSRRKTKKSKKSKKSKK